MTTLIIPPGRRKIRLQAEMRRLLPERRVISRCAASKVAFLRSLDQATWGSALPVAAAPVGLARYFIAVSQGMAILTAGGASREELLRMVEWAASDMYSSVC